MAGIAGPYRRGDQPTIPGLGATFSRFERWDQRDLQGHVRAIMANVEEMHWHTLARDYKEGQIVDGVIAHLTEFGAFIDLGGVDGLCHVTDIARHLQHPNEVLAVDQQVKVKILSIDREKRRVAVGIKELSPEPWETIEATQGIETKFAIGATFRGRVTDVSDYGAFVEIEPGIGGLIAAGDMPGEGDVHPGQIVSISEVVEVEIVEVDLDKRRIYLALRGNQA